MLKALLKTRLSALFYSMFRGSRRKKPLSPIAWLGVGLLFLYVLGCMFFLFGMLWVSLCEPFYRLGLSWLYFAMVGVVTVAVCFIGSVFTAQKQLYSARDNELLLSMPIAPAAILTSRMLMLLLLNYLIEALIVLPAAFVWAYSLPVSFAGAAIFILAFLLLPLLPLTLSCAFGWLLEAVSSRLAKGKNLLVLLLSVGFLAAYFLVYSKLQEYLALLIANGEAVAQAMQKAMPPFYWLGAAVALHDPVSLLLFALCCIAPFALAFYLISRSFVAIATRKTGGPRSIYRGAPLRVASPDRALFRKELSHFLSNAMYMLNAGMGLVMALLAAVALLFKQGDVLAMIEMMEIPEVLLPAALCAMQCLILAMTIIAAPSISLEGKTLWIAQNIPAPGYAVLRAKVRLQFYLSLPVSLVCSIVVVAVSGAGWMTALSLIAFPALLSLIFSQLGVVINLRFPKFDWTSEVVAVKQSLATMLAMFLNWGIVALPIILYIPISRTDFPLETYLALCTLACVPAAFGLDRLLRGWGERTFAGLSA